MNQQRDNPDKESELIKSDKSTDEQIDLLTEPHLASANEDRIIVVNEHEIDRMEITLPIGGWFSVSGKNASQLFWAAGIIGIILALGWTIANIIGALR